ncbi:MAG: Gfo/Idh/MocA family oxidoreductase [Acidimicrobiia bacterium]|nr:Gfo/Idh/MocA family oxidoreductase [Acidimicrobiia bacterium]
MRVGFLGGGLIARYHARSLSEVSGVEIAGCFDIDRERAAAFADVHGGAPASTVDDIIERSDALYVCSWTSAHPELVEAVAAAGKAIFCEKPLAVDLATATAMTEAVERAGVINQVGLVLRRSPAFRWVRHQMNQRASGPIMNVVFRDDQYLPIQGIYGSTWRIDPDRAGAGTLLEHSIHDLDLLRWMIGPIGSISARTANHHGHDGIEDLAVVWMAAAQSKATATLTSIWHDLLERPSQRRVEVFCRDAYFAIEGDWNGPVHWEYGDTEGPGSSGSLSGRELAEAAQGFDGGAHNPDAEFIAAVDSGTPAHPDFAVALEAHRLVDGAYRSAAGDGSPVAIGAT